MDPDQDSIVRATVHKMNHEAVMYFNRIGQLNDPGIRRCWDEWKGAIGGKVVTFLDNVINANVTVAVKDSIAINSETLINELPTGLYLIEKNYNDGSID